MGGGGWVGWLVGLQQANLNCGSQYGFSLNHDHLEFIFYKKD